MDERAINEQLTGNGQTGTIVWPGGEGSMSAVGTWGGGTLELEWSQPDDGVVWTSFATPITLTADGLTTGIKIGAGYKLRGNLTGATGPTLDILVTCDQTY